MSKWNKHALEKKNRFWEKISLRELRTLRSNIALLPIFSFHPFSTDDVKKVIRDLKNNKSVGGGRNNNPNIKTKVILHLIQLLIV